MTAPAKVEQRHRDESHAELLRYVDRITGGVPSNGKGYDSSLAEAKRTVRKLTDAAIANAEQRGREDEREECAVLVSRYDGEGWLDRDVWNEWRTANGDVFAPVAAAIRARGQRKESE